MNPAKQIARTLLPDTWLSAVRRLAVRLGWIAPVVGQALSPAPFYYPFHDLMARSGPRPPYRWGTLCAALHAKTLGLSSISVIEFGVAGGKGLLQLEQVAEEAERLSGVKVEVFGFDTGRGLPKPQDARDLPQLWGEGNYGMDVVALRRRLTRAHLLLGPVSVTVPQFLAENRPPVGFIAFDMDLYSSTMDAFRLFEGVTDRFLPRVVCYFDDILGYSHGDFNGERLAIADFNMSHDRRKISQLYGLRWLVKREGKWTEMMYMFHAFDHPRYNNFDGYNHLKEMPLKDDPGASVR